MPLPKTFHTGHRTDTTRERIRPSRGPARPGRWRSAFVVVAVLVALLSSEAHPSLADGSTWTAIEAAEANPWRSVAYGTDGNGKGVWVAIADSGTSRVMRSTDGGEKWSPITAGNSNDFLSVAYGDGVWVAVSGIGTPRAWRSTDGGVTWLPIPSMTSGYRHVAFGTDGKGNGVWVALRTGNTQNELWRSIDHGENWAPVATAEANTWSSVAYGDGVWVAVASGPSVATKRVMRSTDGGENWSPITAAEQTTWLSVAYGDGTWIAVAGAGTNRVMRSTDGGVTWAPVLAAAPSGWRSVAYGDGVWVAVANTGTGDRVMRSTDGGLTWSGVAAAEANSWWSVAYGDGTWVAVAIDGTNRVMRSGSVSTQLVLTTDAPAAAQSGVAFSTAPVVEIRDAQNAKVVGATDTVTVSIASQPVGTATLSGATTVTAVGGVATFSGLTLNGPVGTYTIEFTSAGLTEANSRTITLGVGPASGATSTITASPPSVPADGAATSTVSVQLKDSGGNLLTSSGGTVTLQTTVGTMGAVTDANNGTYTAVLTSSVFGTATVTGTVGGAAITSSATVEFTSLPQTALAVAGASAEFSGAYSLDLATVTSGGSGTGAVSYAVVSGGTAGGCSVSGATLTATSVGTCLVTATKASDGQFASETSPQATVTFTKASRTLSFGRPAEVTLQYGTVETFVATPSAGVGDGTLTYAVADTSPAGCSVGVSGSSRVITMTASTGSCVVTASIAEGSNHLAATAQVTIVRTRKAFTITGSTLGVSFGTVYTPTGLTSDLVGSQTGLTGDLVGSEKVNQERTTFTFEGIDGTVYGPSSDLPVNAGRYRVLPSDAVVDGGSADDYDFTYLPGILQINRVARTIAFTSPMSATVQYGDTTTVVAVPSVGDGTVGYSVGASAACSVDAATGVVTVTSASGTCEVEATVTAGTNHLDATTTGKVSVTVGARPITVTAGTASVVLGSTVSSTFSVTTGTLFGDDRIASVTFTYEGTGSTSYDASVVAPTALGTYSVTPSLAVFGPGSNGSNDDYEITFEAGTLSIVAPPPPPPPPAEPEEKIIRDPSVLPTVPDALPPTEPVDPAGDDADATTDSDADTTSEPDRRDGRWLVIPVGEHRATSDGVPVAVSVTGFPNRGTVVMRGEGWEILLDVSRGSSTVQTTTNGVLVSLGLPSIGAASGTGFLPGTAVSVWLFSDPILLAATTVEEDGTFGIDFLLDAGTIPPGEHTLQVEGVGRDGFVKAVSLGVVVTPESVLLAIAGEATLVDGQRTAPWTLLALLAGLVLAAAARRALLGRREASEDEAEPIEGASNLGKDL